MKKWFVLLVLALLLGNAEAAFSVRLDDAALLLNADGCELVPAGTYTDIVPLNGERFAASRDGKCYALMDAKGVLLSGEVYAEFRAAGNMLLAQRDGVWGVMDPNGVEKSDFAYRQIVWDGDGGWALRGEDEIGTLWLLDANGRARNGGLRVREIGTGSQGLLTLRLENGLWGCCDRAGEMAIPARYDYLGNFVGNCALAVRDGHYGAVDRTGAWIIQADWDFLEISEAGFILAADAEGVHLWNAAGDALAAYAGEGMLAGVIGSSYFVGDAEMLRVFDSDGSLVAALAPDASVSEGIGEQLIVSEGMWGERCVRLLGTELVYQNLYPLGMAGEESIYACMEANAARYQNDLLHEIQISVDMDTARYGLVDGSGRQVLPCRYISIEYLSEDRFLVRTEAQWSVIDASGAVYWKCDVTQTEEPNS